MSHALFGIENDGLNLAVNLLVFFLAVIWLALVYSTYSDARRRIDDPMLVGCATAASLFPFIGTIVYTIVRPPEYLEEMRERELEIRAAEARVRVLENRTCRNCGTPVEPTFLRCPNCLRRLREPCRSCGKALDPRWKICPYCETETREGALAVGGRAQRRRRTEARTEARPEVVSEARPDVRPGGAEARPAVRPEPARGEQRRDAISPETAETPAPAALPPRRSTPPPSRSSGDGAPPAPQRERTLRERGGGRPS